MPRSKNECTWRLSSLLHPYSRRLKHHMTAADSRIRSTRSPTTTVCKDTRQLRPQRSRISFLKIRLCRLANLFRCQWHPLDSTLLSKIISTSPSPRDYCWILKSIHHLLEKQLLARVVICLKLNTYPQSHVWCTGDPPVTQSTDFPRLCCKGYRPWYSRSGALW